MLQESFIYYLFKHKGSLARMYLYAASPTVQWEWKHLPCYKRISKNNSTYISVAPQTWQTYDKNKWKNCPSWTENHKVIDIASSRSRVASIHGKRKVICEFNQAIANAPWLTRTHGDKNVHWSGDIRYWLEKHRLGQEWKLYSDT